MYTEKTFFYFETNSSLFSNKIINALSFPAYLVCLLISGIDLVFEFLFNDTRCCLLYKYHRSTKGQFD